MIIRTVMQMKFPTVDIEIEMPEPIEFDLDIPLKIEEEVIAETVDDNVENYSQEKLYVKWSDSYKEAHKLIFNKESTLEDYKKAEQLLLSESNNILALYDLGRLYSMEKSGLKDNEKSFKLYEKALQGFIQIEPKAKKIKPYLQYQIGMMYFKGFDTSVDNQKAAEYFEKSAEQGNEYAQNILDNQEKFENEMLASTIFSLFINLSRCIEDNYHNKFKSGRKIIDSKLRRIISQKKQSLGIKNEPSQSQEQSY